MNNAQLEILAEAKKVSESLGKIFDLYMDHAATLESHEEQIGFSAWFCSSYPFGTELFEFLAEVHDWINDMGEGK
jgi:hypothetical protein